MKQAEMERAIAQLKEQQKLLAEQVEWMRLCLKMVGVEGPWVSPQVAGMATGRSRDRVLADIQMAEEWRCHGRKWHLTYGKHYRNDQTPTATQPTWKVHLLEYAEFCKVPPDQIRVA